MTPRRSRSAIRREQIAAQQAEWQAACEHAQTDLTNYLAGKRVVLVGPAASLTGRRQGEFIDSHDVIVRLNLSSPVPRDQTEDLGSRTDVLYHVLFNTRLARAAGQQHTRAQVRSWIDDGVRFVATRQQLDHDRVTKFRPVLDGRLPLVCMTGEFKRTVKDATETNPNTGTLAIAHLLSMPIASLHVTGFDFYATGYHVGYGGFSEQRAAMGTGGGNWGMSQHVPHKQEGQMAYLADLARSDPRLSFDPIAAERLGLIPALPPVVALVPMKGHSERVAGKNVRDLCGKPLLYWTLDALHKARRVAQVVVDTDDDNIARLVAEHHPKTTILRRPDHLLGGHVTGNQLIEWEMTQFPDVEHFGQFHVTSPLLTPGTIDRAIEAYFASDEHDSLFTVTEHHVWLFDERGVAINSDTSTLVRSQDLPPIFEDNNAAHVFSRTSFAKRRSRIGEAPQMFPMSKLEALDIDWEDDFTIAEAVMARRLR